MASRRGPPWRQRAANPMSITGTQRPRHSQPNPPRPNSAASVLSSQTASLALRGGIGMKPFCQKW